MVTLTTEERDSLTPEELKQHLAAEEKIVFGHNFERDRKGQPVEQGIGAPGRRSENHYRSIAKNEGPEDEKKARAEDAKHRGTP
jgi:hypothetical protein